MSKKLTYRKATAKYMKQVVKADRAYRRLMKVWKREYGGKRKSR